MLGAMVVAAFTQAIGTVVFHTITQNRILSPSIMGFDSLYVLLQTLLVFVFGGSVLAQTEGMTKVLVQTALMVGLATLLYRWLFSGRFSNLFLLLLVGVVMGMAFDSLSAFMQRVIDPTSYDMLSVTLFGRMNAADASLFPLAFSLCALCGVIIWSRRRTLDVLLLGRDNATAIGVSYKKELTLQLILIAVMVSFSTALVGPMTFFGFLVATLAYQLAGTYKHAYVMPMAFLLGLTALVAGQFILQHVFYAAGFLTIVIEFVGGLAFLIIILRRGRL